MPTDAFMPPPAYIQIPNPKFGEWVGRHALMLCIEADEWRRIPTPCSEHLREARETALQQLRGSDGRPPPHDPPSR